MKTQKHRRTQSNSEMDLKNTLVQQPCKSLCQKEIEQYQKISSPEKIARIADQTSNQQKSISKQIIVEHLEDEVQITCQKAEIGLNFGIKKPTTGILNNVQLFQIPEQNDLLASTQKSEDGTNQKNKNQNILLNRKINESKDKTQINQINLFEELKKVTINSKKISFTNELQRKDFQKTITPDRKEQSKQQPQQKTQQKTKEKSPFNSLMKTNKENINTSNLGKNTSQIQCSAFSQKQSQSDIAISDRKNLTKEEPIKIEQKLQNIEQELKKLSEKQFNIENINNHLQKQILIIIDDGKRQREVEKNKYIIIYKMSQISFQKIEVLEQIAKKNEETIQFLKQHFMKIYKRPEQDNVSKRYYQTLMPDSGK